MTQSSWHHRAPPYLIALLIGLFAVTYALPWAAIAGTGGVFAYPEGDLATNLIGHLGFQSPGWHWPLLRAPSLAWPEGESVAMTDSNPAFSIAAKCLSIALGHPVNLLGLWLAVCILLQPVGAVFVLRGFNPAPANRAAAITAALAASLLALLLPAYLFRIIHINLLGQFLLLLALGVAARHCTRATAPTLPMQLLLLAACIFVHPYLFIFAAITLAAPALHALVTKASDARIALRNWALAAQIAIVLFVLANGTLGGGGGPGFGVYSMNLLGPFWPQHSGLFGPALPVLDATGFQHEGFNYLGAGNLLLLACAAVLWVRAGKQNARTLWRRWAVLLCVLGVLLMLAIIPRLTAGHTVLLPIHLALLDHILGPVRASGRAIWVVDYALLLAATGWLANRLAPARFLPLIVAVLLLQWADTAPLRTAARAYFAGTGQTAPPISVPPATTLLRVVPLCTPEEVTADTYRLAFLRAGANLEAARMAHPLPPERCQAALQIGLTSQIAPGEARLFLPSIEARVQRTALGPDATCSAYAAGLLCEARGGGKDK